LPHYLKDTAHGGERPSPRHLPPRLTQPPKSVRPRGRRSSFIAVASNNSKNRSANWKVRAMASLVERKTSKGERRLFVKFDARDRDQNRRRTLWGLMPCANDQKDARLCCGEQVSLVATLYSVSTHPLAV